MIVSRMRQRTQLVLVVLAVALAVALAAAVLSAQPVRAAQAGAPARAGTTPPTRPATRAAAARAAGSRSDSLRALQPAPEGLPRETHTIMREVFTYEGAGRRDPFFSLMSTAELRPTIAELSLSGILFDPSGRRPVAVMRDKKDGTQYRLTTGMTVGRMRIVAIRPRAVIFAIDEFGSSRRDSLVLVDTTKVRR